MDPQEGMAWATSAEGKELMTLASQAVVHASVAAVPGEVRPGGSGPDHRRHTATGA
jgi:hypothetical protein